MKRIQFTTGFVAVLAFILFGCNTLPTEVGSNFFKEGALNVSYVDSITVKHATVIIDSLSNQSINSNLIGRHTDEKLGQITASSYFQFGFGSQFDLTGLDAVYDSLKLEMTFNGYHYYDTTGIHRLNVYRVTEQIKLSKDGNVYNNRYFQHEENPMSSLDFHPRPSSSDTLKFKLPDELGRDFFQRILNREDKLKTNENFLRYFNGIMVAADPSAGSSILGFNSNPRIKLYFTDKSQVPAAHKTFVFEVSSNQVSNIHYSNVQSDRAATKLSNLVTRKFPVNSVDTDRQSYLQAGVGLCMRVEFPYVKDFLRFDNLFISSAMLEIKPVSRSFDNQVTLPDSLVIYRVDKNNEIYAQFSSFGRLIPDYYLERDGHYSMDVTDFVREQMSIQENNKNALLISLVDLKFRSRVQRMYAENVKLRIYYSIIK